MKVDDIVMVTGGIFKGMKAKITRIRKYDSDATIVLEDATYQLPVMVEKSHLGEV